MSRDKDEFGYSKKCKKKTSILNNAMSSAIPGFNDFLPSTNNLIVAAIVIHLVFIFLRWHPAFIAFQ